MVDFSFYSQGMPVGALLGLAAVAPVLPGRYAFSMGRFFAMYIVCLLLVCGGAAGLIYVRRQGTSRDDMEKSILQSAVSIGSLPLLALAGFALGVLAVSGTIFQGAGRMVFGLVHALLLCSMALAMHFLREPPKPAQPAPPKPSV